MSSFDRRRALLFVGAAPLLAGCFRPMLAEDSASGRLRGKIALPAVNDRFGFYLLDSLESRLGQPTNPTYRLEVRSRLNESGLLVAQDNRITRQRVRAHATYRLFRTGEAEPILVDEVVSESGYDSTASLYASRTTRKDIEERLAKDLGDRIARRLYAEAGRIEASAGQ